MKKAKQNSKTKWLNQHQKVVVAGTLLITALVLGIYFLTTYAISLHKTVNQASMVPIRELIVNSVEALKKNAPVDPVTGDIYFPESNLYIPNPKSNHTLTYAWSASSPESPEELSVSLSYIPGTEALYAADGVESMFKSVPKLQACSRGVKIVKTSLNETENSVEFFKSIPLQDGINASIYTQKDCPELNEIAEILTKIRAY